MKKLIYIALFAIPAITFAHNVEPFLQSDYHETDVRICCQVGFEEAKKRINEAESADVFFFHKGKVYAYMEIMRIIDED